VDVAILLVAGSATALATGLGTIPVFALGRRVLAARPALSSVVGLLMPAAEEGTTAEVVAGTAAGIGFMLATRRWLAHHELHVWGLAGTGMRTSALVFAVLLVHSVPEGFAIGTAYASDVAGLSLFVILAIALQNVPEGTSTAIPMQAAGFGSRQQFWAAVGTSVPQPIAALVVYALVEQVQALLAVSFAFAAGAMLALVVFELVPDALAAGRSVGAVWGAAGGAALMLALSAVLGV
jgi:zinc transporter, ZIP family